MTFQTPAHGHGVDLHDCRHLVDASVALGASDAFGKMNRMIEIDVIREPMNALPSNRQIIEIGCSHGLERWALVPDLGMAVHARADGGVAGARGGLDELVAITTIDRVIGDVMAMVELNGLVDGIVLSRIERRSDENHGPAHASEDKKQNGPTAKREARVRRGPEDAARSHVALASRSGGGRAIRPSSLRLRAGCRPLSRPGGRRRSRCARVVAQPERAGHQLSEAPISRPAMLLGAGTRSIRTSERLIIPSEPFVRARVKPKSRDEARKFADERFIRRSGPPNSVRESPISSDGAHVSTNAEVASRDGGSARPEPLGQALGGAPGERSGDEVMAASNVAIRSCTRIVMGKRSRSAPKRRA